MIRSKTAMLGASVTLFALALEPFVQQLVVYPLKVVTSNPPNIVFPAATQLTANGDAALLDSTLDSTELVAAVFSGADSSFAPFSAPLLPRYPGGNCVWPNYHTVAFREEGTTQVIFSGNPESKSF
jgi:hypothetical protein